LPANTINISANAAGGGAGGTVVAAVADTVSQTARSSLVAQYNQIIQQITTTAAGRVLQRRQPAER
jgi:hypothetical protein